MDKKFAHDQAAAAAAKTAKQQESPSASPVSQGGNPVCAHAVFSLNWGGRGKGDAMAQRSLHACYRKLTV
eukprot:1160632-Pelagomonas_calceolata.AAC.2